MKKVTLLAAGVLAATMSLSTANAAGSGELYRGDSSYFRAGVFSKNFADDAHLVGRLGNQSDTYAEIAPNFTLSEVDGTQWDFVSAIAYQANQSGAWQDLRDENSTANLSFIQAYLRVKGLFDFDKDAVLWVGKKYNREDSHIVDQYWRNTSGNGVGVENLTLGSGKFSAHWVRQDVKNKDHTYFQNGQLYAVTNNILDAAYAFPVGPGNLELRYTRTMPQRYSEGRQTQPNKDLENGNLFTVKLGMPVLNGWNTTVLRYGKGGNANWAGATLGNDMANAIYGSTASNSYAWDFIDYGAVNFTENFHMLYHVRGTYVNNKTGSKSKMFQAVLRPVYVLTKMTKIMLEPGFYTISYEDQDGSNKANENISKVTLAYAINPDALNVWTRPEIRFFVTYKHYGHDAKVKVHSTDPGNDYDNHINYVLGSSNVVYFGAQAEAWF